MAHAYDVLTDHPLAGRLYPSHIPRLRDLRALRLRPPYLNYAVFYVATGETIDVVRILHGAMNITPEFFEA